MSDITGSFLCWVCLLDCNFYYSRFFRTLSCHSLFPQGLYSDTVSFPGLYNDLVFFQGLYGDKVSFPGLYNDSVFFQGLYSDTVFFQGLYSDTVSFPGLYKDSVFFRAGFMVWYCFRGWSVIFCLQLSADLISCQSWGTLFIAIFPK